MDLKYGQNTMDFKNLLEEKLSDPYYFFFSFIQFIGKTGVIAEVQTIL
jgi:hypothetical protein